MSSSFSGEEVFESEYRANNWAWDVPDAVLVLLPNKTDDTMMAAKCPQLNQYDIKRYASAVRLCSQISINLVDARWRGEVGAGEDQVFRGGQSFKSSMYCKKSLFNVGWMGFMNPQELRASRDRQLSSHPARSITTSSCRFLVFRSRRRRKSWQTVVPQRSSHSRAVCGETINQSYQCMAVAEYCNSPPNKA